ncbi:MAG: ATP-binding protein [Bacteroidales bacterium]|nr:ATP-binding protein [Bacteroidales bacterium]
MLVNFTVGNFLSFREKKTLSLEAAPIKDSGSQIIEVGKLQLLPSAALYGANSSGKSNFLHALGALSVMVNKSSSSSSITRLPVIPFLLDKDSEKEPSFFEIEVITPSLVHYRYGFECTQEIIVREWLYRIGSRSEKNLFIREGENIGVASSFSEGKGLEERTRSNALFLSVCDAFNGPVAKVLVHSIVIPPLPDNPQELFDAQLAFIQATKEVYSEDVIRVFKNLDFGFTSFEIPSSVEEAKAVKAWTTHNVYDENGQVIGNKRFSMKTSESAGTNRLFDIIYLIMSALAEGSPLVVDEVDRAMHPLITKYVIGLFNNAKTNPKGAQLIFTTHDTNLLSSKIFRRDQIRFVEKDKTESSDLFCLAEFKDAEGVKVRNDRSFEKDYIQGKYGAIPYLNYDWED